MEKNNLKLKCFIHISWRIHMSENTQGMNKVLYTLTHMAPLTETSTDDAYKLTGWLASLVSRVWGEREERLKGSSVRHKTAGKHASAV